MFKDTTGAKGRGQHMAGAHGGSAMAGVVVRGQMSMMQLFKTLPGPDLQWILESA
jgi:hypothetical protein